MKPCKLIINAFGPFAGRQELDFSALEGTKIFLITGETGAGKTTLFDAVSFALYGNASSESRRPQGFKSQHAKDNELCYVQLTFDIKGNGYTVYRAPAQLSPKRDGSLKEVSEKAELTLPNGNVISGTKAVSKEIENILSLTYSQFKQTIMLAQGEFRRFIESNSTQKQEILSKLFSTEIYGKITAKLIENEAEISSGIASIQKDIARVLAELAGLGYEALAGEEAQFRPWDFVQGAVLGTMQGDKERLSQISVDIELFEKERAKLDLNAAKSLNEKIEQYNSIQAELKKLQEMNTGIQAKQKTLDLLLSAKDLKEQEEIILSTKESMENLAEQLDGFETKLPEVKSNFEESLSGYEKIAEIQKRISALSVKMSELEYTEKKLAQHIYTEKSIKEYTENIEAARKRIDSLEEAEKYIKQQELIKSLKQGRELAFQAVNAVKQKEEILKKTKNANDNYEKAYKLFLTQQSSLLATGLTDGVPCPVCGSVHHPAPANMPSDTVTGERVNELREKSELLQKEAEKAASYIEHIMEKLCIADSNSLKDYISAAEEQLAEAEKTLFADDVKNIAYGEDVLSVDEKRRDIMVKISSAVEAVRMLEKSIEDESNADISTEELALQKQQTAQEIPRLSKLADSLNQAYISAKSAYEGHLARQGSLKQHYQSVSGQFSSLRSGFLNKLKTSGFSGYKEYKAYTEQIAEISSIKTQLDTYSQKLSYLTALSDTLAKEVAGREKSDIASIEKRINEIDTQLSSLGQTRLVLHTQIEMSAARLEEARKLYEKSGALGSKYACAHELAVLARGSRAPNISFERYILASYFEDILQVANIHLQRMTSLRYKLSRKKDASRGTSGLDMDVIDSYTGNIRAVSTLSGGEGFKASLALALGLSDVVQMYAGGVSIETMFIDEGFGSLDEKSLDSVMETLISLENTGRTVGIISHVPLLRSYIPAKLVVNHSATGSNAFFKISGNS